MITINTDVCGCRVLRHPWINDNMIGPLSLRRCLTLKYKIQNLTYTGRSNDNMGRAVGLRGRLSQNLSPGQVKFQVGIQLDLVIRTSNKRHPSTSNMAGMTDRPPRE